MLLYLVCLCFLLKPEILKVLDNFCVVLSVGDLYCSPKFVISMLCFLKKPWHSRYFFDLILYRCRCRRSCPLAIKSVNIFWAMNAFEYLSCLSESWRLLSFADWFSIDVVWGFWSFLLGFTNWIGSLDWLYQFVSKRSLYSMFWVRSERSSCLSFPSFDSVDSLLEVRSTLVREQPCFKLFLF